MKRVSCPCEVVLICRKEFLVLARAYVHRTRNIYCSRITHEKLLPCTILLTYLATDAMVVNDQSVVKFTVTFTFQHVGSLEVKSISII